MSRNVLAIRILLILMVMVMSLMGTSALAQSGTVVRVDPSAASAQVNDNVNLSIKVDNVANLTAIELHLSFNPGVLEVLQVTNGGFVVADFTAQSIFDNTAGTIDYAVAQMNRPAAQGSGTLLNISFRAKANGNSTVALRPTQAVPSGLLLSDQNGMAISASWVGGNVNVGNAPTNTSTPVTPGTITVTLVTPATATQTPSATVTGTPPTATVTPTPTATTPAPPPSGILGNHVVRFGEYLYCLGRAYGVSPWAIAQENGIWWPYLIFPGQTLRIPNVAWVPIPAGRVCQAQFTATVSTPTPTPLPTATATPNPTAITSVPPTATATATAVPSSGCRYIHIVQAGENLFRIGLRYGVSYSEIARVNQISDPTRIYVGQQLCIP
ncbi:MAG: LysM peptidoglycan-binding domain-containing protein [Chloroflexi bacterium]|nr:LysM peptidoglycan-binding domain-containing protein [Chloroflexota bacterium]